MTPPTTGTLPTLGTTCQACGAAIQQADRGRPRRFCDATCRSGYRRLRDEALARCAPPKCAHPYCTEASTLALGSLTACSPQHARLAEMLLHVGDVVEQLAAGDWSQPPEHWRPWTAPEPEDVTGRYVRGAGWSW